MTWSGTATQVATRRPRRAAALFVVAAAQLLVMLDAWVVSTALPSIAGQLRMDAAELAWVSNAYVLMFGALLLLGGRLTDALGPRRLFVVGGVVLAGGSVLGGTAGTGLQLIAGRALQGVGAALLVPAGLAVLVTLFAPGAERERAIAVWGTVASLGAPLGALLGGALTEAFGWSATLLVNVPLLLAALCAAPLLPRAAARTRPLGSGVGSALTAAAAVALGLYALIGVGRGRPGAEAVALIAAALLLAAVFALSQRRAADPLLPPLLLRIRSLRAALVLGALAQAAQHGAFFFLAITLQQLVGLSPLAVGLAFAPYGGAVVLAAAAGGLLVGRAGLRVALLLASAALAAGSLAMAASLAAGTGLGPLLPAVALLGAGGGVAFVAVNALGLADVGEQVGGLGASVLATAQQLGAAAGVAGAVVVHELVARDHGMTEALCAVFVAQAVVACLFGGAAWALAVRRGGRGLTNEEIK